MVKIAVKKQFFKQLEKTQSERLDYNVAIEAVKTCLKYAKEHEKGEKLIHGSDPVHLYFHCLKKMDPSNSKYCSRFKLTHPLVDEDDDICLIVRDDKGEDAEKTVEKYENVLKEKNINIITKIYTYSQIVKEFTTFELKRKLCSSYDLFICDLRLGQVIGRVLGKNFIKLKKIPININVNELDTGINSACCKTPMKITPAQDCFSCVVGHTDFSEDKIADNILAVINQIQNENFPGGWINVRSTFIKTNKSIKFPLIYSLAKPKNVEVPSLDKKKPKACVPVIGELSTATNANVKVDPDGTVTVFKSTNSDQDDDSEEVSDFEMSDDDDDDKPKKKSPGLKKSKTSDGDDDEDDMEEDNEDDDDDDDDKESDEEHMNTSNASLKKKKQQKSPGVKKSINRGGDDDNDDLEEDDEEDDDSDKESDEEDMNTSNASQNSKKRKLSVGSANGSSKKNKRSKVENTPSKSPNKNGKFDTSLGESWKLNSKTTPDSSKKTKPNKYKNQNQSGNKNNINNNNQKKKKNKCERKASLKVQNSKKK